MRGRLKTVLEIILSKRLETVAGIAACADGSDVQFGRVCALCCLVWHFGRANAKTPAFRAGVSGLGSLTITYFHTGIRTIIGVESFHGPVRDGKGWDRLAMVIRQRGLLRCFAAQPILEEAVI